ncbi:MAG TPA: hypothetical protein PKD56_06215 [Chitinophagales bacterium]|nr:hypothetical protein [Chitinophagales bacterium]
MGIILIIIANFAGYLNLNSDLVSTRQNIRIKTNPIFLFTT